MGMLPTAAQPGRAAEARAYLGEQHRTSCAAVHGGIASIRGLVRRIALLRPGAAVAEVTPALLLEHEAALPPGKWHLEDRLAAARRRWAGTRWAGTGAGGLAPELAAWLAWAPFEAHAAERAVRTCSRTQGAPSPAERDRLLAALHAGYASGAVTDGRRC